MTFVLPNPTVPTNGQALDATPILQNEVAIAQAIESFDASQIQAGTLVASAFNANINPNTILNETTRPFVQSGCIWSSVSSSPPVGTMTGGTIYINGFRVPVNSVPSHTFTATRDTYIDIDVNGNITYVETTNGGSAPALTANSLRVALVSTNTTSITNILQALQDSLGNNIRNRLPYSYGPATGVIGASESTSSTSYTDLATVGPTVNTIIGPSGIALVIIGCDQTNATVGSFDFMGFTASGANTISALDVNAYFVKNAAANTETNASYVVLLPQLNPGLTTFTAKYRVNIGTGTFASRILTIIPF